MKMLNFSLFVLIMIIAGTHARIIKNNQLHAISDMLFNNVVSGFPDSSAIRIKQRAGFHDTGINPVYINPEQASVFKIGAFKTINPTPELLPYARVRIEIAGNNTTYECSWDDSAWFPDYVDSLWNYDFNAFLVSLGGFLVSWGDGKQDSVKFFNQSCSHVYTTSGHYMVTVFSIYAFFNDEAVRTSGNLYQLKNLNFANCPNLHDTPVLSGLSNLQVLDLRATGITESPATKNLANLQYLYFNGTAILKPPDLTTNTNIRHLSFHGCNYLSVQPLVSKLTRLEHLDLYGTALSTKDLNDILYALCLNKHPDIRMVNLRVSHAVRPEDTYISLFQATYPLANLYTN